MAEAEPVEIVVEIIDSFSEELAELRGELESLDLTQINIDADIDDDGDIEELRAQIEALREEIDTDVDFNSENFERIMAERQALSRNLTARVRFVSDKATAAINKAGGPGGLAEGIRADIPGVDADAPDGGGSSLPDVRKQLLKTKQSVRRQMQAVQKLKAGARAGSAVSDAAFPGLDVGGGGDGPLGGIRGLDIAEQAQESRAGLMRLRKALGRLTPNIMDVWNAMAMLIPVFVTLIGAAIGLAGALIAVGAAGAAVLGLGLIGWGDSLSESFQNAQQAAQQMAEQIATVLQPVATEFQPILQDWMEGAPRQIQQLVGPLRSLLSLTETVADVGAGIVDWTGLVMQQMGSMSSEIDKIVNVFGRQFGAFLIDMMSNMVQFTAENTEELVALGSSLRSLLSALFEVSVAVALTLSQLSPFFDILAAVAGLLNNQLVIGLLTAAGVAVMLETTIAALTTAIAAMAAMNGTLLASIQAQAAAIFNRYLPALWGWITAVQTLRAQIIRLLAVTGAGIVLATAGSALGEALAPDGNPRAQRARSGGSATNVTNINVAGNMNDRQMHRVLDQVPGQANKEINMVNEQRGP